MGRRTSLCHFHLSGKTPSVRQLDSSTNISGAVLMAYLTATFGILSIPGALLIPTFAVALAISSCVTGGTAASSSWSMWNSHSGCWGNSVVTMFLSIWGHVGVGNDCALSRVMTTLYGLPQRFPSTSLSSSSQHFFLLRLMALLRLDCASLWFRSSA